MPLRLRLKGYQKRFISRALIYKTQIPYTNMYRVSSMSLTFPHWFGWSKLQSWLAVDQRTETFFIFADLCLTKKAANILFVRSGAFWICRPLGLSKELNDDKCLVVG